MRGVVGFLMTKGIYHVYLGHPFLVTIVNFEQLFFLSMILNVLLKFFSL